MIAARNKVLSAWMARRRLSRSPPSLMTFAVAGARRTRIPRGSLDIEAQAQGVCTLFSISTFSNRVLHNHFVHRGPDLAIFFWGQESRHSHRDIIQRMGPGEHPWIFAARLVVELPRLA